MMENEILKNGKFQMRFKLRKKIKNMKIKSFMRRNINLKNFNY